MTDPTSSPTVLDFAGIHESPERPKPQVPDHELIRRIGSGAYGDVWLARNVVGTYRAVKVVYRNSFQDARPYEREFHGLQKFEPLSRSNDGFVDILQIGRNDDLGHFYYLMELADDAAKTRDSKVATRNWDAYSPKTLRTVVQHRGRLPFEDCLQYTMSLNLALGQLHRQGLIHRDIKPSNIIFVGGVPKLADIGLMTAVEEARSFVGTEGFIPPEGPNSPQADIYSLGKVLYEMSMGKDRMDFPEPFTALGQATGSQDLEELNTIILKACATLPQARYQTAEDMQVDLALLHSGKSVKSKRILERRLAFARKAGAVVGVIAMLAFAAYLYQQFQTREARRLVHAEAVQRARAEGLLHTARLKEAETYFERDDAGTAVAHLARMVRQNPSDHLAAMRLQSALTDRSFAVPIRVFRQDMGFEDADFSPDGKRIVFGSGTFTNKGEARIYDALSGETIGKPMSPGQAVITVRFSPDGRYVATGACDSSARIWDATTGEPLSASLGFNDADAGITANKSFWVWCTKFSPDGQTLITADQFRTRLWKVPDGEPLGPMVDHGNSRIFSVEFSPDGKHFLTSTEGVLVVKMWNSDTGKLEKTLALNADGGWAQFSPDGKRILTAGGTVIRIWNIDSGQIALELPHKALVYAGGYRASPAFSPDGLRIVSCDDQGAVRLWNAQTGQLLFSPIQHKTGVEGRCFDPSGERLLVWEARKARVWDSRSGRALTEWLPHPGEIQTARFDPEGSRVLVTTKAKMAVLWDVRPSQALNVVLQHGTYVTTAKFSPDGNSVLTATGGDIFDRFQWTEHAEASVWDALTGDRRLPRIAFPTGSNVQYAEFNPDGQTFLTAHNNGQARVWNAQTGVAITEPLRHLRQGRRTIYSARFSPDGQRLATVSADKTARVWDARTGQPLIDPVVLDESPFASVFDASATEFSPDGRWVLTSVNSMEDAVVWDSWTGKRREWKLSHDGPIYRARYSAQGDRIATASADGTARVWDSQSGQPLGSPLRHQSTVRSVSFSPDGQWVLTASDEHTARVWDARTGQPIGDAMRHQGPVLRAEFSRDGRWVVTASADGTARMWDAQTGRPLTEPFRHDGVVGYAEFSPDGRRIVTGSTDYTARVWELPLATVPVPDWMAELAEAMAGQRMNQYGDPEPVTPAQFFALKERIMSAVATHPLAAWAQWLFADRLARTTSPSSQRTGIQHLNRLIEPGYWDGRAGLPEVVRLSPGHAEATARSSGAALAQDARLHPERMKQAEFLAERALNLDPKEPHAWRATGMVLAESGRLEDALEAIEHAIELRPDFGPAWTLKGQWLEQAGRIEAALEAFTQAVASSASSTHSNPRGLEALNTALLNRARVLDRLGRLEESSADNLRGRDIAARDPKAKANLIDLSSRYNLALRDDLSVLPRGIQRWGGVPFDVRGAIRFGHSLDLVEVTNAVTGIRVNQRCRRLHFLHSASLQGWPDRGGTRIGTYTVHYADGHQETIPIVLGKTIGLFVPNYWWGSGGGEGGDAEIAVWLANEKSFSEGLSRRILQLGWDNPHPETVITSVDTEWSSHSDIQGEPESILLVAITAQSEPTPKISRHPKTQTVAEGDNADFAVDAEGENPLAYQWQFNGQDLLGETNAILSLSATTTGQAGCYAVQVRNAREDSDLTVTCQAATLVVTNVNLCHGVLRREVYSGVSGEKLADLTNHSRFPSDPDESDLIHRFETPSNVADKYGVRVTGYLIPPKSGDYRFFLCSDDEGALFLSSDESAEHKQRIATDPFRNHDRLWTVYHGRPMQENRSAPIRLEAGRRYYVEALMKEGRGGDNLAVTWQMPGDPPPGNFAPPIPGTYLAVPTEWLNPRAPVASVQSFHGATGM